MSEIVVLGLGTNKVFGTLSCKDLLKEACRALSFVLDDIKESPVYRTKPMYVNDQPDFFNMVVSGTYEKSAYDLLFEIHKIEESLGRNRAKEIRFGQRSLDIDIEIFGSQEICSESLQIPHPRLLERAFVLLPLVDLISENEVIIPKANKYISALSKIGINGAEKLGEL